MIAVLALVVGLARVSSLALAWCTARVRVYSVTRASRTAPRRRACRASARRLASDRIASTARTRRTPKPRWRVAAPRPRRLAGRTRRRWRRAWCGHQLAV